MTRIEKAIKEIVRYSCPDESIIGEPTLDVQTVRKDERNEIIGCRGITCEQCWNAEAKE